MMTNVINKYPGVIAEVHYTRACISSEHELYHTGKYATTNPRPVVVYCEGVLTTAHSTSSYGQPVFVAGWNNKTVGGLMLGQAYGPGDLPEGYEMIICPNDHRTDPTCLPVAARSAGYNCYVEEPVDGYGR